MNTRQRETSREIRLWITGIIAPSILAVVTVIAGDPELRTQVSTYAKEKINAIKKKFKKGKGA